MKQPLRIFALIVALGVVAWWFSAGQNRGWTKTSVGTEMVDEITGIEYIEYEDRFVPGVDMLGIGLAVAVVIGGISFFVRGNGAKA